MLQGLHAAQEQNGGWLSDELIAAVAKYLEPAAGVGLRGRQLLLDVRDRSRSAATTSPSAPTSAAGSTAPRTSSRHAEKKLGCKLGESTADGRVYLKREEECLAACCGAPMVVINGHYHEKLDAAKVDELLDGLK